MVRLLALVLVLAVAACKKEEAANGGAGAGQRAGGGGGGGGGGPRGGGPGGFGGPMRRGGGDGPRPVEVATIATGTLARTSTITGALEPLRTVGVNAQTGGALQSVRVEEGDMVRAGQVLAEIDTRELAAQLRSAEASYNLAKSTAERSEKLFRDKVMTGAEVERDRAALAAAEATVEGLRTRIGYGSVKAPMAGVVTEKRVETGDVVSPQTRLFSIADVNVLVARVDVSELDVSGIDPGDAVDVTVDALGGTAFRGTVRRVFPAVDTTTRLVPVEIALSGQAARRLKPGYMARVTFRFAERPGVIFAPSSAVVGTGESRAVFVVESGKAHRRPVKLGQESGEKVEILDGLKVGETVVAVGAGDLRDGAQVRVVPPAGSGESVRAEKPDEVQR